MNLAHHARAPRMRARRAYILLHNATSPYFYLIACLSRKMNSRFRTRTDYRTAACEFVRTRRTRFARPRWRVASNIGRRCSTGKLKQEQLVGTCNPTYNKRLPLEDKFGLIRGDPATCCLVDRRQLFLRALPVRCALSALLQNDLRDALWTLVRLLVLSIISIVTYAKKKLNKINIE
jgi:hypothetical protein